MKPTIAFLALAFLPSCTMMTSNPSGTSAFLSLGGDSQGVMLGRDGAQMASNANSGSFKHAATIGGLAYSVNQLSSAARSISAGKEATSRAGLAAKTDRAGLAAGTERISSGNATTVKLAKIARDKEIGLKALDIPAP